MAFKLIEAASERGATSTARSPCSRRAKFEKGALIERPDEAGMKVAA